MGEDTHLQSITSIQRYRRRPQFPSILRMTLVWEVLSTCPSWATGFPENTWDRFYPLKGETPFCHFAVLKHTTCTAHHCLVTASSGRKLLSTFIQKLSFWGHGDLVFFLLMLPWYYKAHSLQTHHCCPKTVPHWSETGTRCHRRLCSKTSGLLAFSMPTKFLTRSPPDKIIQAQSIANWKDLFQLAGTILIWGPKYSSEHLEQGAFNSKNHTMLSCSSTEWGSFVQASDSTEAKVSN